MDTAVQSQNIGQAWSLHLSLPASKLTQVNRSKTPQEGWQWRQWVDQQTWISFRTTWALPEVLCFTSGQGGVFFEEWQGFFCQMDGITGPLFLLVSTTTVHHVYLYLIWQVGCQNAPVVVLERLKQGQNINRLSVREQFNFNDCI